MKFNTNDLGYKLREAKMNRKHSEQINKYTAGLFDADGCCGLVFQEYKGTTKLTIRASISQAFTNDPDSTVLIGLRTFYNIGTLSYWQPPQENASVMCTWKMSGKEARKLFNLISKHLRVKGTHFNNICELYTTLVSFKLSENAVSDLKEYSKCSRKHSTWLKQPKHPSWAWLAGYLDGDGHYQCRLNRRGCNELAIQAVSSTEDRQVLEFIKKHLGGSLYTTVKGVVRWRRGMGKSHEKFALPTLKKLRKYSCLQGKYKAIQRMIEFHEKNKSQRLNKLQPKG